MKFETGKYYNFDTICNVTIPARYENMRVESSDVSFTIASKFIDVLSVQDKISRELGRKLTDPKLSRYVIFTNSNGEETVLSYDWIIESSIVNIAGINLEIRIDNVTTQDAIIINNMLRRLGYTNLEMKEISIDTGLEIGSE